MFISFILYFTFYKTANPIIVVDNFVCLYRRATILFNLTGGLITYEYFKQSQHKKTQQITTNLNEQNLFSNSNCIDFIFVFHLFYIYWRSNFLYE